MPSSKTSKIFADRLQDLIADKKKEGKDLAAIAKELDISVGALSNYQNDKAKIKIDALRKIADYFNVSCDFLTGKIATKFPRSYEVGDELGLSDESIEHLKILTKNGATWVINSLFKNGLRTILEEAETMHNRKYLYETAFGEWMLSQYDQYDYNDHPEGSLDVDSIWEENNLDLERDYLREKGESVSFVLDRNGNPMDGVVNIRMEVNQYLSWRFGIVGDKFKAALIEVLKSDEDD